MSNATLNSGKDLSGRVNVLTGTLTLKKKLLFEIILTVFFFFFFNSRIRRYSFLCSRTLYNTLVLVIADGFTQILNLVHKLTSETNEFGLKINFGRLSDSVQSYSSLDPFVSKFMFRGCQASQMHFFTNGSFCLDKY